MQAFHWVKYAAFAALCSLPLLADHGDRNNNNNNNQNSNSSFASSVIGSTPVTTIGGVASGGAPWVVRQGDASLSSDGRLQVHVQGLLITAGPGVPPNLVGTVGPVQMVAASLVCGGSGGFIAAGSMGVPLSAGGNAEINAQLSLPAMCPAPVILVRIFNNTTQALGPFIAETGLAASSLNNNNNNGNNDDDDPLNHH